jgi:hypothetical protein
MAEIHQYATNSNQAIVRIERTGIFGFSYNPGGDSFRVNAGYWRKVPTDALLKGDSANHPG